MNRSQSTEQAFRATTLFLETYYDRTHGEGGVAELLGDIQINVHDGIPMDPAAWQDRLEATKRVLATASATTKV